MEQRKPGYHAEEGDAVIINDPEHLAVRRRGEVKKVSTLNEGELYVHLDGDPENRYVRVRRYQCEVIVAAAVPKGEQ